ncbi:ABC transporter substrate-binding protein [Kineococcus sp. SYSU DK005]|uniref:ABC transporter substrate-binding protein n=1 Tax=Kineococcus sp. SYSU DK005 TaxID=3383126 RepID=UPI003D7DD068
MSRRAVLGGLVLGAAGAGGLTACSSGQQAASTSGAVDIGFWTHDPSYVKTFQASAADADLMAGSAFQDTINPVSANGSDLLSRTITQAVAGQSGPGMLGIIISEWPRVMKPQMAENLFVDLSDLTTDLGDDLLRTEPYSVDGRLYALESDSSISVFYYRQDEFEAHGIDPQMQTWEDYLQAGEQLAAATGKSLGMVANGDNTSIFNSFLQFLLQRGGAPFDADGNLTIDTPEVLETLDVIQRGVQNGTFKVLGDPYGSAAAAALKQGELIAIVMPNWYNVYGLQANVPEQAGLWRMRTLPRFTGGGHIASNLGGTGFAVGLNNAARQASVDLLKRTYLTPEGQLLRYQIGGYLPTIKSLYSAPEFTDITDAYLGDQRVFDVYAQGAQDIPSFYQSATMQQLSVAMGAALLGLYSGAYTPERVVEATIKGYREQTRQA